jgi:hypothetical protein
MLLKRLTMAVFVTVTMAAAGGAQILNPPFPFPFPFAPSGPPEIDHFHCYFAVSPIQPVAVQLQDQFDVALQITENITDLRAVRLCNPVQKNIVSVNYFTGTVNLGPTTPINHPADHLVLYLMNPQPITPVQVYVENQFGFQTLNTRDAIALAVPSGKVLPNPNNPSGAPELPPIPTDLNHFKCYSTSGSAVSRIVFLQDQFQSVVEEVLDPILFCNPVQKTVTTVAADGTTSSTVTPIVDPVAHLTCYTVTPRPFQALAYYNNQFVAPGTAPSLTVLQSDILCAPSYKLRWSVIPPPNITVPGTVAGSDLRNNPLVRQQ